MGSPNINDFTDIPASTRKPGVYGEWNAKLALRALPGNLQRICVLGPRTSAGTVAATVLTQVFSAEEAATYFGRGSVAHRMVRALLAANRYASVDVIGIDDHGSGVAATKTITAAGTATSAGTATIKIGNDAVVASIAVGDTANTVAAAINAAINAAPDLAVSSAVASAVATLTARNKGTVGNALAVSATVTAAGITATVAAGVTGATDPSLTAALAAIFTAGHQIILSPWADSTILSTIKTHLDSVSNGLEMRGALAVYGWTGTIGNHTTLSAAINSARVTGAVLPSTVSPNYELAAAYAAVIAAEEDPARPLNSLPLVGIAVPPVANWLTRAEQETLLYNGGTPIEVSPGGSGVQIVRAAMTYTVNASSVADPTFLDITTIRIMDYTRTAWRQRMSVRFSRDKKTARVKSRIRDETLDVLYALEGLEIIENVKTNAAGVIVEDDTQDATRVNVRIPTDVVNGLHILAARFDLIL